MIIDAGGHSLISTFLIEIVGFCLKNTVITVMKVGPYSKVNVSYYRISLSILSISFKTFPIKKGP